MVLKRCFAAATLLLGLAWSAAAHDAHDPRHQAMEDMGERMKALRRAAEGPAPLGPAAQAEAAALQRGVDGLLALFPAAGEMPKGSRARPEIWTDWSGFSASAAEMQAAAGAVAAAVRAEDKSRLAATLRQAGAVCASCHDRYRTPDRR